MAEGEDRLQVREAAELDEERVRRAMAAKAGLAQQMSALQGTGGGLDLPEARTPPGARVPGEAHAAADVAPAGGQPTTPPGQEGTGVRTRLDPADLARRLNPEPVRPSPPRRRNMVDWLLGREQRQEGSGPVTRVPPLAPGWEEVESYPLEEGFSFVRIERDQRTQELLYRVVEPELAPHERDILQFVEDALVRGLDVDPSTMRVDERSEHLRAAMEQILRDYRVRIDDRGMQRVGYYLRRDFLGLGAIQPLMLDPDLEDISCDGPGVTLFVFHRRYESIPTSVVFATDVQLDGFVIRLAQRSGRAISISDPILDAALPDGSRLQATLGQEVTQNGSTFTIRRFKPDPFNALDLLRFGTLDLHMLAWFWINVQHGHSLILSGGTASGKTTSLNALAQFIPPQAKIVSIEDTREVNLPHQNWIKAVTRSGSTGEGTGEIGMFELLKASLRQRPEYILVGEVRGVEATVAFQAMATGHTVFSTIHADSARSVVYRLENDPINVPRLVLQALDIVAIQAQKRLHGQRVRRLTEVVEVVGIDPGTRELLTNTVFRWDPATDGYRYGGRSYLLEQAAKARNWSGEDMQQELERRMRLLQKLLEGGLPVALTDVIRTYYRDPAEALRMVGG